MKPIRLLSHLLNAVFVVSLGLAVMTYTGTAEANEAVTPTPQIAVCAICVAPNGAPCGGFGTCRFLTACTACFCLPDPIFWGNACL